ncbi:P27 family phage terminase small subunit [Acuticoccus sp. M5D2P5]|uniref:P27 family phage terminase small subunit n=1 Tax=Acuticoccus kalidii TaxID=2910977 RepID=UPI001F3EAD26|nr:P27 family phage terminase small subunit [Acuticoccus kalidii]
MVPLTTDAEGAADREARFAERARARADELRPDDLDAEAQMVWDRMAPRVTHPTIDRLHPQHAEAFAMMCQARARHLRFQADLAENGWFYESRTRNGVQYKARPEVAQMNEAFRQFLTLARDFGLTPMSERAVREAYGQGNLFDDDVVEFA